jgi:hypothetical protein
VIKAPADYASVTEKRSNVFCAFSSPEKERLVIL